MKNYPYPDIGLYSAIDQKEYLEEVVRECQKVLKLDAYVGKVLFPGETGFEKDHDEDCLASINTNYPYREFEISVSQKMLDKIAGAMPAGDEWLDVERVILHELGHVLVATLADTAIRRYVTSKEIENAEENLADHIAILVHALVCEARWPKIPADALSTVEMGSEKKAS